MTMNTQTVRNLVLIITVFVLALSRLLPHPWNFTPIAAMALFGGAYFRQRGWALVITLGALFTTDVLLQVGYWIGLRAYPGFYRDMVFVYASIAAVVLIGRLVGQRINVLTVLGGALGGSLLFFVVTNLGVWLTGSLYTMDLAGLSNCFVQAIPFYRGTLLGDLFYSGVIFGAFQLAQSRFPALVKARS